MKQSLKVAVVGATGAVGTHLLQILETQPFPIRELLLFASPRSEGQILYWRGQSHRCHVLRDHCFEGVDLVFFDSSDVVSKNWVMQAAESGAWVVDNSAYYRMDPDTLLLVPEVNGELLKQRLAKKKGFSARERILSGPNCATVQLVLVLKPIQAIWGLKRVVVSTYQSVSGAGILAMKELRTQTLDLFQDRPLKKQYFPHPIAFNCIPHIGSFNEEGNSTEELKIIQETQKILGLARLKMTVTAVRVPTLSCHAEAVHLECEKPFKLDELKNTLKKQAGLVVQDDPTNNRYPLGMTFDEEKQVIRATGEDLVYVGRIRQDLALKRGVNLWIVADNLRKGAALNAVQIGEMLLETLLTGSQSSTRSPGQRGLSCDLVC